MSTFADALAGTAARSPHRLAVVDEARRLTYAQLDELVDRVAGVLWARGAGPGDVVTSQLPNGVEALALCLAVNRVDAVHNPVATIYRGREIEFIQRQAASAMVVRRPDDELFEGPPAAPTTAHPPDEPDAPRFLLYTSGSTAEPKGVLHSDRTLAAECAAQSSYHDLGADEVFVMPSPVAHVSGLLYGVLLPIWLGATSVLMPRWDPGRFLELVESERGTFSGGATPFLQGVADHPDLSCFDTSSLRAFPCGGADVPPDLIRRACRRLGIRSGRGYGSTEFPSITSGAGPDEPEGKRAETDGRPIGANEVRVIDGEIQARGPELFLGYRNEGLDADAFTEDGWFRTGDLGALDADGYLTVTGRLKDVIVRSGEKFSARELEELLVQHPKVASVAVIARPDERTGERACACVVPTEALDRPTLAELGTFLSDAGLSLRKLPEQLEVVDDLPMTASGKVDKRALRQLAKERW
ncbi:MAG: AMP-binding protein [Actinomycetota bacterium]|nr:AMP-binding protein [Actinomycetota bacterium]